MFKLAEDFGYKMFEKCLSRDEVHIAEKAFFAEAAAEVTPIREMDNRTISQEFRGSLTENYQT